MKDCTDWCVVADFLRNREITEGRRHSTSKIAYAVLGGGHRVNCHSAAILQKHQLLVVDAYYQTVGGIELCELCGRKCLRDRNETKNHSQRPTHAQPFTR
jgi:hypothetical protein